MHVTLIIIYETSTHHVLPDSSKLSLLRLDKVPSYHTIHCFHRTDQHQLLVSYIRSLLSDAGFNCMIIVGSTNDLDAALTNLGNVVGIHADEHCRDA